jgi:hypothetical protein
MFVSVWSARQGRAKNNPGQKPPPSISATIAGISDLRVIWAERRSRAGCNGTSCGISIPIHRYSVVKGCAVCRHIRDFLLIGNRWCRSSATRSRPRSVSARSGPRKTSHRQSDSRHPKSDRPSSSGFVLGFHDRVNKLAVLAPRDHDQASVDTQAIEHCRDETRPITAFASLFHYLYTCGSSAATMKYRSFLAKPLLW